MHDENCIKKYIIEECIMPVIFLNKSYFKLITILEACNTVLLVGVFDHECELNYTPNDK